jgi:hypothetical protein
MTEAFRTKKAAIELWRADARVRVREFAERFVRSLDLEIASEQRRSEQWKELRQRDFDTAESQS